MGLKLWYDKPAEWSESSVSGLCAKGGIEVDMSWAEGCLETVRLRFSADGPVTLGYKTSSIKVEGRAGGSWQKMLSSDCL